MRADDSENIELRFLVPSKIIGLIIGKAGTNIKRFRKKYPIIFKISENPGPERTLCLEGDPTNTMEALEAILQHQISTNEDPQLDLRLLVHNSQAGIIIGKGGAKIKEFRENSGLRTLKVYQEVCPNSTDRVVQIVGEIETVLPFILSVSQILKCSQPKTPVSNYDAGNFNENHASYYGGWSQLDQTGAGLNSMPKRNRYDSNDPSSPNNFSYYTPNKNSMPKYNQGGPNPSANSPMMNDVFGNRMHSNHQAAGFGSNGHLADPSLVVDMMRTGMPPNRMAMNISLNPTTTTQVSISDKMIGAIMGKGGSRINQVRRESGADIKINKHDKDVEDRIITITGTPDQIQNAQFLLQVCVRKYGEQ